MATYQVKQSSTAYPLIFLMVDSTDHVTGKTGLSPTVTLSKSGGSFASPSGAVSEIGSGWYKVAGNATDSATLGPLALHATGTGADPVDAIFEVVAVDPQNTSYGLANLDAQVSTRLPTASYSAPPSETTVAAAVWDRSTSVLTTSGSVGKLVTDNLNATVSSRSTYAGGDTAGTTTLLSRIGGTITISGGAVDANVVKANGTPITTVSAPTNFSALAITSGGAVTVGTNSDKTGYSLDLTQTLSAARAVTAIADTSLTMNDALHCSIASAAGQETLSGTTYTVKTPSTGTTIRVFTLNSATTPTTRT